MFEFCVESTPSDKLGMMEYRFNAMILGNIQFPGLFEWFLGKASIETDQSKAEYYFSRAVRILYAGNNDKPILEELYDFVEKYPKFTDELKDLCICEIDDWRIEDAKNARELEAEEKKNKAEDIKVLSSMLDLIRTGQRLNNLNALACHYNGFYSDSSE